MLLGAHLSIAGNLTRALQEGKTIGANTIQIFSGPPRGWLFPLRKKGELEKFKKIAQRNKLKPIFIHAKYLINLSSSSQIIRKKSIRSLKQELNLAEKIGAAGVIFHPHPKNLSYLLKSIRLLLESSPVPLILENSAQTRIEEIGKIIKMISHPRLGFCLDTAHAYQRGYDLNQPDEREKLFSLIKNRIGLNHWLVIHANDSKTSLGSCHDQHADIGRGKIKPEVFFVFLNHPFSRRLPFILETPAAKTKGLEGDRENLKTLSQLVGKKLNKKFFQQPTLKVAQELLGKYLFVYNKKDFKIGKIIETEAYVGPEDQASHAFRGKTKRTKIMFGPPGRLYIYLIYGRYHCLNIVTEKRGYPAAVLIRAITPVWGIREKTDGPGKVCRALGLTRKENGADITLSKNIFIKDIGIKPKKITTAPRVGVDYAGKWAKKKWRFLLEKEP